MTETVTTGMTADQIEQYLQLKTREVRALEKISSNVESLAIWFEDVDKESWSDRIQWYLSLWKENYVDSKTKSKN